VGTLTDDYDAIYIMSPMPIKALNWTLGDKNSTGASMSINYWNGSWVSLTSVVNGTSAAASCAFGQDGSMAWRPPSDEITKYMYGANGFWYQTYLVGGSMSGLVNVRKVTYDASFQPIHNVWDGTPANPVEVQLFASASLSMYTTQAFDAVNITSLDTEGKIYIATVDPAEGFYVDMGTIANSHSLQVSTVGIYCGQQWSNASNVIDGTQGFTKSGWITFRRHTSVQPVQFGKLLNYAYWY
jgi:hypothetical protein